MQVSLLNWGIFINWKLIVATNISNIEEYLSNRENVMLVKPEDIKELSEAILYLLLNPSIKRYR